jgi:hypothetical protein
MRAGSVRDMSRSRFASQRSHQLGQQKAAFVFGKGHGWSIQPRVTVAGMSDINHVGTPWMDTALTRNGSIASAFSLTMYGQLENQQGCHDLIVLSEIIQQGIVLNILVRLGVSVLCEVIDSLKIPSLRNASWFECTVG